MYNDDKRLDKEVLGSHTEDGIRLAGCANQSECSWASLLVRGT